jgi:hypothetical protein
LLLLKQDCVNAVVRKRQYYVSPLISWFRSQKFS